MRWRPPALGARALIAAVGLAAVLTLAGGASGLPPGTPAPGTRVPAGPASATPPHTTPASATPPHTTPAPTTPAPTTRPPATRAPVSSKPQPVRYRPVGCVRRGPTIAYHRGYAGKVVALSFDDGPWSDTAAFVGMLERSRAVATFFMIGRQVTGAYRATILRELRDGDALGDHTFTHPYLTRTGDARGQLSRTASAIRSVSGYMPCVFRPPYGAYDQAVVRTAGSLGMATIIWNVDPADWAQPGVGAIEQRVLAQVRPGSIILSHDGGGPRGQTLAAYPAIISALRARGYRFATVPELLGFHTVYRRCVKRCDGIGITRRPPRGWIVP